MSCSTTQRTIRAWRISTVRVPRSINYCENFLGTDMVLII
jgi:hypothetical protein